jgi:hypothetical protein
MNKKVSVIYENENERNERFRDNSTGKQMTRNQFVKKIEAGSYPDYHIRKINDKKTPVSNPDNKENNNLD